MRTWCAIQGNVNFIIFYYPEHPQTRDEHLSLQQVTDEMVTPEGYWEAQHSLIISFIPSVLKTVNTFSN